MKPQVKFRCWKGSWRLPILVSIWISFALIAFLGVHVLSSEVKTTHSIRAIYFSFSEGPAMRAKRIDKKGRLKSIFCSFEHGTIFARGASWQKSKGRRVLNMENCLIFSAGKRRNRKSRQDWAGSRALPTQAKQVSLPVEGNVDVYVVWDDGRSVALRSKFFDVDHATLLLRNVARIDFSISRDQQRVSGTSVNKILVDAPSVEKLFPHKKP